MSVEVGLEYVYDLADVLGDWSLDGHPDALADANIQLSADGMSATVFVPEASIRGFSITAEELPYVRINSMASRADWQLAYSFVRFAADRNANPELPAEELTDEAAVARGTAELRSNVAVLQSILYGRGTGAVALPIRHFAVDVTRADLPEGSVDLDALEGVLIGRVARYAKARVPSVLTIDGSIDAVVWSGEALLTLEVDCVILGDHELFVDWKTFVSAYTVERPSTQEKQYYFPPSSDTSPLRALAAPLDQLGRLTKSKAPR
jgi:hypothetical protein